MTMTIGGTSGLVFPDSSTQNTAATGFGFKNRIINGAMTINQRDSSTTSAGYTLDRWYAYVIAGSKMTVQKSSDAATGFSNSLLVTSTTALSVASNDYYNIQQSIEGFNTADLAFGTANAATVTLSFWAKSSLTGTFGGSLQNSAENRSYPFTYTISSANTWEQKSVTISGDTSGTWIGATNGIGMRVCFGLTNGSDYQASANAWTSGFKFPTGAVNILATNGATFYITGVQLEKGSTATSFDYRPYTTELQLCQRYLPVHKGNGSGTSYSGFGLGSSTVRIYADLSFQVEPRVPPTGITTSAASSFNGDDGQTGVNSTSVTFATANLQYGLIRLDFASGITTFRPYYLGFTSSAYILWTGCEL